MTITIIDPSLGRIEATHVNRPPGVFNHYRIEQKITLDVRKRIQEFAKAIFYTFISCLTLYQWQKSQDFANHAWNLYKNGEEVKIGNLYCCQFKYADLTYKQLFDNEKDQKQMINLLKKNEEFVCDFVRREGSRLEIVDPQFRSHEAVARLACENDPRSIEFVDCELAKKMILEALENKPVEIVSQFIGYMPNSLACNREFLLEIFLKDANLLRFLSERAKEDPLLARLLIKFDLKNLRIISKKHLENAEFSLKVLKENRGLDLFELANVLDEKLLKNKDFAEKAVKLDFRIFRVISRDLKNDKQFIIKLLKAVPVIFDEFSDEMQADPEIIAVAGR